MLRYLSSLLALLLMAGVACAAPYNGSGSVTRPDNATSYGTGAVTKLLAGNTSGDATPMSITVRGVLAQNIVIAGRLRTTDASAFGAAFKVHLFTAAPTVTGLIDGSTYVGPYTADLGSYVGTLICSTMTATTDASPSYYSDCTASNPMGSGIIQFPAPGYTSGPVTLYGMVEVTTGYTPTAKSVITVDLATM